MKEYPWGKGTPKWVRDGAANDSDKSFTVPTGKVWELLDVCAELATTADAGNRYLRVDITNGTNHVMQPNYTAAVAASKYAGIRVYFNCPLAPSTTAFNRLDSASSTVDIALTLGLGRCILPAGYVVRVWDTGAVQPAADDLTVVLHYVEYDV